MGEWIRGTLIYVNLNASKRTSDWSMYMRTTRNASVAFQTYIIHNTKDARRSESETWWTRQSNVHGVVIARDVVLQCTIYQYPRRMGSVVEHFIPGIEVAETDFKASQHIDITTFLGKQERIFFKGLVIAVSFLRQHLRGPEQRQELRYAGRSFGIANTALAKCNGTGRNLEDDEDDVKRAKKRRREEDDWN